MHTWPQPVRLYYFCPVFRYERPQAGRFRQHHQFGVEAIGEADPAIDAEVIELGWRFNRQPWPHQHDPPYQQHRRPPVPPGPPRRPPRLLPAPRRRQTRPAPIACSATSATSCVCWTASAQTSTVRTSCPRPPAPPAISATTAPGTGRSSRDTCAPSICRFKVRFNLVRGLDYYTRTVFEIQPEGVGGAQNTVLAGGRYDGLIEELGGRPTPGIGFGSGLERLILNVKRQETPVPDHSAPDAVIVALGDAAQAEAHAPRGDGCGPRASASCSPPPAAACAASSATPPPSTPRYTLIIGDDEIANAAVQVKHMATGDQRLLPTAGRRRRPHIAPKLASPSTRRPTGYPP